MAYFKIEQPNQPPKWIKSIDRANCTLEFTTERTNDCFQQDSGFFADSELAYLKFHFTETYPELEYLSVDCSYGRQNEAEPINHLVGQQIQDMPVAPNEPWAVEEAAPQYINQIAYTVGVANPVMEARAAAVEADLPWGDGINEEAPRPIYYNRAYVE